SVGADWGAGPTGRARSPPEPGERARAPRTARAWRKRWGARGWAAALRWPAGARRPWRDDRARGARGAGSGAGWSRGARARGAWWLGPNRWLAAGGYACR